MILTVFSMDLQAQKPYELSSPQDVVLLGAGFPILYFGYRIDQAIPPLDPKDIMELKQEDVNSFDRIATYHYSEKAADLSDILVYTCLASPLALLFSNEVRRDAGVVYTMYGESLIYGVSFPLYSKEASHRFRPYVYNPEVPDEIKLTRESRKSFFSGHTSVAFTSMIFFASVFNGYYPESQWRPYIWTGSVLLASSVGYLRVTAGKHYPTDVLVGALVGTLIGYIIPKIHETNTNGDSYPLSNPSYKKTFLNVNFVF